MLDGHVALVTGAAGGIGLATAQALAGEGAEVALADLDEARLDEATRTVGPGALAVPLDVTRRESWERAVAAVEGHFGHLSILVNNAGISEPADIETVSDDAWNRHLAVNLTGVCLGMQVAAPALRRARRPAAIVNVASMLSLRPGAPFAAYCASKAGMVALSQSAALHFAETGAGIRVNTVHPGAIRTPMLERYLALDPDRAAAEARFAAVHPLGRVGEAQEVAAAILFLVSPAASFITGAALPVDGGGHIRA
ncbi:MAG: SDR family oxidoreductase [Sphingomonadaceae bacterium]|uniref:SDR family NAD(P)-dependent oxidoreductase n=1 Tax=Thermaurantiacus sp. TaxID=2820283 RepID=UPI00298F1CA1|nr:SDR family oxidoreductase [Thermaurantiacus sp.]MCS6987151.1 SDR family oxidoreductase [Sphingomonadaceae bacterium]MDW8415815.1 SDR family oxidoreductase [Thermaurantiacus sp.]